jgi:hypothetical protein
MKSIRNAVAAVAAAGFVVAAHAQAPLNAGPYVPSPSMIVDRMLELADIKATDFVIDLGSGDGRIPITAAQRYGASGFGVDIDPKLVKLANDNAVRAGVGERVRFEQRDLFATDLSKATVVTVYLLPSTVTKLVPKMLAEMQPGARVISHDYPLAPWPHDRFVQFDTEEKVPISGTTRTVLYLYTVPARVGGEWTLTLPGTASKKPVRLSLVQHPFRVTGTATVEGRQVPLNDIAVHGADISFTIPATGRMPQLRLTGKVSGEAMDGSTRSTRDLGEWRAARAAGSAKQ